MNPFARLVDAVRLALQPERRPFCPVLVALEGREVPAVFNVTQSDPWYPIGEPGSAGATFSG